MSVRALPSMTWGAALRERGTDASHSEEEECALCMDIFAPSDEVRVLPCGHHFHLPCIDRWFTEGQAGKLIRTCPLCAESALV